MSTAHSRPMGCLASAPSFDIGEVNNTADGSDWTLAEDKLMRERFSHQHSLDIAASLGRSLASVRTQARRLGLHKSPQFLAMTGRAPWSPSDDTLLQELYPERSARFLAELTGRSVKATKARLERLGLQRKIAWSAQEDALLVELYPDQHSRDLAMLLGRPYRAVEYRAARLQLCKSDDFYAEHGMTFYLYPPELREVVKLQNRLRKKIHEHQQSA